MECPGAIDHQTDRNQQDRADNERTRCRSGWRESFEGPPIDRRRCIANRRCDDRQLRNKLPPKPFERTDTNNQAYTGKPRDNAEQFARCYVFMAGDKPRSEKCHDR